MAELHEHGLYYEQQHHECPLAHLLDSAWYGGGEAANNLSAQQLSSWYLNPAATGSTPSLYEDDDLPNGPPSALLPEALPPPDTPNGNGVCTAASRGQWALAAPASEPVWAAAVVTTVTGPAAAKGQREPQLLGGSNMEVLAATAGRLLLTAGPHLRDAEPRGPAAPVAPLQDPQHHREPLLISAAGGGTEGPAINGAAAADNPAAADGAKQALGTWVHRQYKLPLPPTSGVGGGRRLSPTHEAPEFSGPLPPAVAIPGAWPSPAVAAAAPAAANGTLCAAATAPPGADCSQGNGRGDEEEEEQREEDDEEAIVRAAWRWRFAKRWQAEQARQLDPAGASGGESEGMEGALAYLAACGQPWEVARTMSTGSCGSEEPRGGLTGTLEGSLGLLGGEQLLFGEAASRNTSLTGSPGLAARRAATPTARPGPPGGVGTTTRGRGGGRHGAATRELGAVSRRGAALLAAQTDLESAADERWRAVQAPPGAEAPWVGALLDPVQIDDYGAFRFVLARLRDRCGRQKMVVRGANRATESSLIDTLQREVASTAAAAGAPAPAGVPTVELVGGGTAQWRSDRDRHLHLSAPFAAARKSGAAAAGSAPPMAPADILGLAGVLARQSLPIHYRVTTDDGKRL